MNHTHAPSRPALPGCSAFFVLATVLWSAAPFAGVHGQQVDRGVFRLFVDGEETGTEEFTVRRIGSGDALQTLARGTVTLHDGRSLVTVLRLLGPAMLVNEYSAMVTGSDTLAVRVVRAGNRLRTRTVAPWGEEMREYRARPSTVLFDQDITHHYFLLSRYLDAGGEPTTIHAFAPLAERKETAAQLSVGSETIVIAGERFEATRIELDFGETGGTAWFDGSGRLVRVALPARGFVAERESEG